MTGQIDNFDFDKYVAQLKSKNRSIIFSVNHNMLSHSPDIFALQGHLLLHPARFLGKIPEQCDVFRLGGVWR